jgi:multiple sugar transport system permease protein
LAPSSWARGRLPRRERRQALLFLSPWLVGFAALVAYPVGASLYYSFTRYDGLSSPRWVGLDNYRFMLTTDPLFWKAVRNTLWLVAIAVPLQALLALGLALLLNGVRRGLGTYRTVFYLPAIAPLVAATLAFSYLLDPAAGPVNQLLHRLHLPEPLWFFDPAFAKPGLTLLSLWGVGPAMIVFLAGLSAIPQDLYEMAAVEGAGPWQRFRHVSLPKLSPFILFVGLAGVIEAFGYFTQAYVAARVASPGTALPGSPEGSTLFYSVLLYKRAFLDIRLGYASAMAWLLLALSLVAVLVLLRATRSVVHYGAEQE